MANAVQPTIIQYHRHRRLRLPQFRSNSGTPLPPPSPHAINPALTHHHHQIQRPSCLPRRPQTSSITSSTPLPSIFLHPPDPKEQRSHHHNLRSRLHQITTVPSPSSTTGCPRPWLPQSPNPNTTVSKSEHHKSEKRKVHKGKKNKKGWVCSGIESGRRRKGKEAAAAFEMKK